MIENQGMPSVILEDVNRGLNDWNSSSWNHVSFGNCHKVKENKRFLLVVWEAGTDGSQVLCGDTAAWNKHQTLHHSIIRQSIWQAVSYLVIN